jgi:hypothetical protein
MRKDKTNMIKTTDDVINLYNSLKESYMPYELQYAAQESEAAKTTIFNLVGATTQVTIKDADGLFRLINICKCYGSLHLVKACPGRYNVICGWDPKAEAHEDYPRNRNFIWTRGYVDYITCSSKGYNDYANSDLLRRGWGQERLIAQRNKLLQLEANFLGTLFMKLNKLDLQAILDLDKLRGMV